MALDIDSGMVPLASLLDHIDHGRLVIPDFQRPFVWSEVQVKSLLATVLAGWPAGSILAMRGDTDLFRLRELEDAPTQTSVRLVVLDGQQRLTSLYSALRNVGPTVYSIDVLTPSSSLSDPSSIEERIESHDRSEWARNYSTVQDQARHGRMPIWKLGSPADFFEWRDEAIASLNRSQASAFNISVTELYRSQMETIHRYLMPVVNLDGDTPVTAVARIFEKVNRSGTELGTFDLMVARLYEPGWNLRDEWEKLREDHPEIEFILRHDGMPLLEAISLHKKKSVRRSTVLNMDPSMVREMWHDVTAATLRAVRELVIRFGVRDHGWIPYRPLLVALIALQLEKRQPASKDIAQWYWTRCFTLGYDAAANTRVATDFAQFVDGGVPDEERPRVTSRLLLETGSRRSHRALYASFMSYLAACDGLDLSGDHFREAEQVSGLSDSFPLAASRRQVASILPKGLAISRFETAPHLRCLSQIHASRRTAGRIERLGFGAVVEDLVESDGQEAVDQRLMSQFLPSSQDVFQHDGDWRWLLGARVTLLSEDLRTRWAIQTEGLQPST